MRTLKEVRQAYKEATDLLPTLTRDADVRVRADSIGRSVAGERGAEIAGQGCRCCCCRGCCWQRGVEIAGQGCQCCCCWGC